MKIVIIKLAAASALLSLASAAMASTNGGTVHFSGRIVAPPCSADTLHRGQVSLHCDRPSTFDVSFQRVGPGANPAATVTLSRDGKPLGSKEATAYRMALQGHAQLDLSANPSAAGSTLGPVIMSINYQ